MDQILPGYYLNDATWFYLSFLLILPVFFKFNRVWSIRNLDLALLLSISPGLLLVVGTFGAEWGTFGYAWLFTVTAVVLLRTLCDGLITRRPRLEQNMNSAGMAFLCAAAFLFLTTKILRESPPQATLQNVRTAKTLIDRGQKPDSEIAAMAGAGTDQALPDTATPGPGAPLLVAGVEQISKAVTGAPPEDPTLASDAEIITVKVLSITSHMAIILGLVLIGRQIFGDPEVGFAMSSLYMLLPCTAYDVAKVHHVLPAALVVWVIWAYRRPVVAGMLLGLAGAMMFFPVFLMPLWASFYGRRGWIRFALSVVLTFACIASCLLLLQDKDFLVRQMGYVPVHQLLQRAFESTPPPTDGPPPDFWQQREPAYIIPVFVAYLLLLTALTIWPTRKSLAQMIPYSAAVVIGTQIWSPSQGGVSILWYLPLLLLTIFRPQMTNHFAPDLDPIRLFRRRAPVEPQTPVLAAAVATGEFGSE